jgi:hypothetical protein
VSPLGEGVSFSAFEFEGCECGSPSRTQGDCENGFFAGVVDGFNVPTFFRCSLRGDPPAVNSVSESSAVERNSST